MPLNSPGRFSSAAVIAALLILGGCTSAGNDKPLAPSVSRVGPTLAPAATDAAIPSGIVISQVYGGGGNSGATLKNDFVEIYNGSMVDVPVDGWSVQYASSAGTGWQATALSGTIPSGHYYLVQEGAGTGGTAALPTPDAVGAIAMSATAGKVALVSSSAVLSGSCPTGVVDFVGFGTAANCFEGTAPAATLSNTTAAIRKDGGRQDNNQNGGTAGDFTVGAPMPRNSASTPLPALNVVAVSIDPSAPSAFLGSTVSFTATAAFGGVPVAITSAAWTSSNTAVATIDPASGVATTAALGTTNISVAVTTANGKRTAATKLTVTGAARTVSVSPKSWNLKSGASKQFAATAVDEAGTAISTTYSWTSSDPTVAMVDATTGNAIGHFAGVAKIAATAPNGVSDTATVTVTAGNVSVSTRTDILPVGFQTQLFVNNGSVDTQGAPVGNSNVLWSSSNADIVSVDAHNGVITANGPGSAVIKATAVSDGIATGGTTITTGVLAVGANARVGHNTELGVPTDADPSDDVIITRRQYTLSYNAARGVPNWVSWNLDDSHKSHTGSSPRCNCFTADTALTRLGIQAWNTQDWVNGGTWSRGHMSPSADWADAPGDNAPTFFLSNMIPQNQTANSGAWGLLENDLRAMVEGNGKEIYIIAGPIFTKNPGTGVEGLGWMKSSGRIAIPDSMWKVAIVVPDTRSAGAIGAADVQVIAVAMPNDARSVGSWTNFSTTIDRIEHSTGYDLLSILPADVQCRIEVRNCAPVARLGGDLAGGNEGDALTFSASSSTDADPADVLSYQWTLAGEPAGSSATLTHTFADNGSYALRLIVSDDKGAADTADATIVVANVAPRVAAFDGATILAGEVYSTSGSFTDPGADSWRGSVSYGDGSSTAALAISGMSFSLEHQYTATGSFTVAVNVLDKDGGMGGASALVVVQSPLQGIANLGPLVAALGGRGGLNAGRLNSLQVKLNNASARLGEGNSTAASNVLGAFLNELDALGKSGRASDAAAAPIADYARRVIASIGG